MIGGLRGVLVETAPPSLAIECGGVTYAAFAPLPIFARLPAPGGEARLIIEMVVRQDSQTLYAFLEKRERELFRQLLRVSGVGAKSALGIMSGMETDDLIAALKSEDISALTRLPGVGRKTAARLALEFQASPLAALSGAGGEAAAANLETEQALSVLGYKKAEIDRGAFVPARRRPDRNRRPHPRGAGFARQIKQRNQFKRHIAIQICRRALLRPL